MLIPGVLLSASHVMIESKWSSDINTWSSLVHFFVTLCRWVGIPGGSAKSRPRPATALIRTSALSSADLVNSLVSFGLSQCGWCRLKSPIHMIGFVFVSLRLEVAESVRVKASSWCTVSFFSPSL